MAAATGDLGTIVSTGSTKAGNLGPISEMAGSAMQSATNIYLADKAQKFSERMASTQHQRETADLIKAGLNPMLSGMGGSGAQAPTGIVASVDNPARGLTQNLETHRNAHTQRELERTQAGVNRANAANIDESTKNVIMQQGLNSALTLKTLLDSSLNPEQRDLLIAQARSNYSQSKVNTAQQGLLDNQSVRQAYQNIMEKAKNTIYSGNSGAFWSIYDKLFPGGAKDIMQSIPPIFP